MLQSFQGSVYRFKGLFKFRVVMVQIRTYKWFAGLMQEPGHSESIMTRSWTPELADCGFADLSKQSTEMVNSTAGCTWTQTWQNCTK